MAATMAATASTAGRLSLCSSLTACSQQASSLRSSSVFWGHCLSSATAKCAGRSEVKACGGPVCLLQGNQRPSLGRREVLAFGGFLLPILSSCSALALIEADDDEELLEKVKEARKERLAKQQEINDFNAEKSWVQKAVYKLSRAGQLLDESDFSGASDVLGTSLDTEWIKDVKAAFDKVGTAGTDAVAFTSALSSLQTAVSNQDAELSKKAFVSSATALESWTKQAGFSTIIKGL